MGYNENHAAGLMFWKGLESLEEVSELTDTTVRTLKTWSVTNPVRFEAILSGACLIKAANNTKEGDKDKWTEYSQEYLKPLAIKN